MTGSCNYEVEGCGGSFAQAAPPTPGALSMMTPGSMPAESETWCFIHIMGEVGLGDFYRLSLSCRISYSCTLASCLGELVRLVKYIVGHNFH